MSQGNYVDTDLKEGLKKTEESVTTFRLGLPPQPSDCDQSQVKKKIQGFLGFYNIWQTMKHILVKKNCTFQAQTKE